MTCEPRTLTQMQHRLTSYEIVARHQDGRETRLGFSERTTKRALLAMAQAHSETLLEWLGSWDGEASYSKATGWQFGPLVVCFSGRTERDCACLPPRAGATV